jgi:hypothetical protein
VWLLPPSFLYGTEKRERDERQTSAGLRELIIQKSRRILTVKVLYAKLEEGGMPKATDRNYGCCRHGHGLRCCAKTRITMLAKTNYWSKMKLNIF